MAHALEQRMLLTCVLCNKRIKVVYSVPADELIDSLILLNPYSAFSMPYSPPLVGIKNVKLFLLDLALNLRPVRNRNKNSSKMVISYVYLLYLLIGYSTVIYQTVRSAV